jgi:periplasmic divalent cation tolerance protein
MSDATTQPIVVLMTAANSEEATRIANWLVNHRLAACVQLVPEIQSIYRWQGKVARETEILLVAKTMSDKFDELERAVRDLHSYDTPEIVAIPATAVSAPYSEWLRTSLNIDDR